MPRRPGTLSLARAIGVRIRQLRLDAGSTQEALAWSCGLAKPYLSQIESGKRLPSLPVLVALAKRLGVETGDLLPVTSSAPRTALMDALRRGDRAKVGELLEKMGYRVDATPGLLVAAEPGAAYGARRGRKGPGN